MRAAKSSPAGEFPVKVAGAGQLLQAARDGDYETAKRSLKSSVFRRAEDVNRRDDRGSTALHYAVKISHLGLAALLLDKGGEIGAEDRHGWSALHYAVRYASIDTVSFLLDRGANIHSQEKRGWNLLHLAARNGQAEKARLLLERGVDVHARQSQGWNALHLAVRYGQPDTISTLLEYGINIDCENEGWTALQLAALNGHVDIVSILLNKGAQSGGVNREGRTALDIARAEGQERIAAIILETEFQGSEAPRLPSPPPSPPTAPPLELVCPAPASQADTFDQWRLRLRQDLENISNDDTDSEMGGRGDHEETEEVRIRWKSFEEEKAELLQQLEAVRQKEVTRIGAEIGRKEERHKAAGLRTEKQRHLLLAQIENTKEGIPAAEEHARVKYRALREDITQLSVLLDNCRAEAELVDSLRSLQIESDFCPATAEKRQLLAQLEAVQAGERAELDRCKRERYQELELVEGEAGRAGERAQRRVAALQAELQQLQLDMDVRADRHRETVAGLQEELGRAERARVVAGTEEEEEQFACPVCLELLRPPRRIFQCPEVEPHRTALFCTDLQGHILCEVCRENPALVHCPQCRLPLEHNCSRNRALEEVARTYFPNLHTEL